MECHFMAQSTASPIPELNGHLYHWHTECSPRTKAFLAAAQQRMAENVDSPRRENFLHAFFEGHPGEPFPRRYALAMAYALENEPVYVIDDELLCGMVYQVRAGHGTWSVDPEAHPQWAPYCPGHQIGPRIDREIQDPMARCAGAPGHIGWRWDRILAEGVEALLDRLRSLLETAPDAKARELYEGAVILWESVLRWNDRHVEVLQHRAAQATGDARAQLEQFAAVCERVPRKPARTFHEALQSYNMQHLAVLFENPYGGNGPGCMDRFLWPYLKQDLDAGLLTLQDARELVDELFIRFEERLNPGDGWVEAVVVGGRAEPGIESPNPLSYLLIESIRDLDIVHPSVYVRLCPDGPGDFLDLTIDYLLNGANRAQVYNDAACLPAIESGGVDAADALDYMAGGCMEISPQGMHSDMNFVAANNVAKLFERVLMGEERGGGGSNLTSYGSFEELYAAFENEMARVYPEMVRSLDIAREEIARLRPCYLLSSLVDDCLERGREQLDGGARYHDYGVSALGLTSVADSLTAIKTAVFDDGFVSAEELLTALRADFAGHEDLRARLAALPKYGSENPDADAMCDRVVASVCNAMRVPRNSLGGALKPMVFNFVWTPEFSRELSARADGSHEGDLIGHGLTPQRAGMTKGLSAAVNSACSLDWSPVNGGATSMWDMDSAWITPALLRSVLNVFLANGGMIFQGNMTSVADLEDAIEHPGRYPHLTVRVGGYSARFTTLDSVLQQEILRRYRHAS
jgi:pyruvate-formate lyase